MAGGSAGFDVDPEEIDEHSKKVGDTLSLLHEALSATQQNQLQPEAFGLIGQLCWLDTWGNNAASEATRTLEAAVKAGDHHVETVQLWAKALRVDEESVIALIKSSAEAGNG
jgi:hypothetical protein